MLRRNHQGAGREHRRPVERRAQRADEEHGEDGFDAGGAAGEQDRQGERRQRHDGIGDEHDRPAVPAIDERSDDRPQDHLGKQADERGARQDRGGARLEREPPDERELDGLAAEQGEGLAGPEGHERAKAAFPSGCENTQLSGLFKKTLIITSTLNDALMVVNEPDWVRMAHETARKRTREPRPAGPPEGTMTLTALDQVWALADPLRVRMLGAFSEERTTRQVAEILDEKPTRLYHHLKALASAGLIRKTRTRRNRGTLETYYCAVAGSFRADPALFAPSGTTEATESIGAVIGTMLDQTAAELNALIASGAEAASAGGRAVRLPGGAGPGARHEEAARPDRPPRDECHRSRKKGRRGRRAGEPDRRYRLSIAFFPLDLPTTLRPGLARNRVPRCSEQRKTLVGR